jgi:hypothetical protein
MSLTFVPTVFVLILGQITPLMLLASATLLYFERQKNWVAFGCAVAVLLVKPHLVFLFWIVFALWLWQQKNWRVVCGAVLVGTCAAVIPLLFNPQIYRAYFALQGVEGVTRPLQWPTPTFGNVIKIVLHLDSDWVHIVVPLAAVIWVYGYWQRHKQSWRWSEQLPLLLLVSVASNFFTWTYDQVLILPALIQGTSWLARRHLPWYSSIAALLYVAVNLSHAVMRVFVAEELWYFWLTPVLFIAYLVYRREEYNEESRAI